MTSTGATPEALRDLETLRELLHGDGRDRAYVDAMIRMEWARTTDPRRRDDLADLLGDVMEAASNAHLDLRCDIRAGTMRGDALRKRFDRVPPLERDHFVEEVLGIAYPPLEEPALARELVPYSPSGYDEVVHAFDVTKLAGGEFLDIGSGAGKAVMLAALLCRATSCGVELNPMLTELATRASGDLRVADTRFLCGDARETPLEDADVVFMYLPFTGNALRAVMSRMVARRSRQRFLCCGALDLSLYPDLVPVCEPRSWLHVYAWR